MCVRSWILSADSDCFKNDNTYTTILQPCCRSTSINWHPQLRTGAFCCSRVLLPATNTFRLEKMLVAFGVTYTFPFRHTVSIPSNNISVMHLKKSLFLCFRKTQRLAVRCKSSGMWLCSEIDRHVMQSLLQNGYDLDSTSSNHGPKHAVHYLLPTVFSHSQMVS